MVSGSTHITLLKFLIIIILAFWVCVWVLKPTQLWKKSWHKAEDWADSTFLGETGLNVIVFSFPILAVSVLGYSYLHISVLDRSFRKRSPLIRKFSNPIIVNSFIGIISTFELIAASMFIFFLMWTYYSNISSDLKKLPPSKSLVLNRSQSKIFRAGVRFGSLSEACLMILLIPILRGMGLLNVCGIQFEASIRYHIWTGNALMLSSVLHGVIIMFVWASNNAFWSEITSWQKIGRVNLAGAIALLVGIIIWITSLPQIRRKNFQFFYLSHHFYMIFILFFLLHAGAGHFYLVLSGVLLFALDKILRIIQSRKNTHVSSACILPCKAVEITIPKDPCMHYPPMSTLFVKIPSISKLQWHPFSVISSSNMEVDTLSILIKCQGPWTNSLYDRIKLIEDAFSEDVKSLSIAVEGPYGPANFPFRRYENLILVAGGSGITPLLSILQDIASRNDKCKNIQLIYAVKKSQDLTMLTSISSLLLKRSPSLPNLQLKLYVTEEKEASKTSVTEILQDLTKSKMVFLQQCSESNSAPKPEGFILKSAITGLTSVVFLIVLVCLSHIFIHDGKRSSQIKTPNWTRNLLVVCSFIVSVSCSITSMMIYCMYKKSLKDGRAPEASLKKIGSSGSSSEKSQDVVGQHEIRYGQRPNFQDILLQREGDESEIGVFVCGPESMQASVASVCKDCSRFGKKNRRYYAFHSINFTL